MCAKILEFKPKQTAPEFGDKEALEILSEFLAAAVMDSDRKKREAAEQAAREEREAYAAAKAAPRRLTIQQYAARLAYEVDMAKPTPNEEGFHVGDILTASWGYDMTIVDFYQIVDLKGKHTAIIREIGGDSIECGFRAGHIRPTRDGFISADTFRVRTSKGYKDEPCATNPKFKGRHYLYRTTDDAWHAFDHND